MKSFKFVLLAICVAAIAYFFITRTENQVKVIFLSGEAYLEENQKQLQQGDSIPKGTQVKLGENSVCYLQMPEGGVVKLSSKTVLEIKKQDKQSAVHLATGKLEHKSTIKKTTHVTTPHGTLTANSNHFQIEVDEKETTLSVYEGEVSVQREDDKIVVKANEGSTVSVDNSLETNPLPTTPKINAPKTETKLERSPIPVNCDSVEGASRYLWEYSLDSSFAKVIMEQKTKKSDSTLLRPQKDGAYYLRVRAINKKKLTGSPSAGVQFEYHLSKQVKSHIRLAKNYYINNKYQACLDEAQKGLRICGDHIGLQQYLACSFVELKKVSKAKEIARKLKKDPRKEARKALKEIKARIAKKRK